MTKRHLDLFLSEPVVFSVILLNAFVLLMLDVWPQAPEEIGDWVLWVDYFCIVYFVFEVASKIALRGFRDYWADDWNKLDLVVIAISLPILLKPAFPEMAALLEGVAMLRLLRFLRLWRLLRYVQTLETLRPLKWPTYALLSVTLIRIGLDAVDLPSGAQQLLATAGPFAEVVAVTWLMIGLYDILHAQRIAPMLRGRIATMDESLLDLLSTVARLLIGVMGLSLALEAAGKNPLALFAGLGIGGMAIAFAAQDAVSNVIAGVLILLQRPFRLGELIRIGDLTGTVVSVGLRATQIVQFNEEVVSIPNRQFIDQAVTNVDRRQAYMLEGKVRLHLMTPVAKIDEAIGIVQGLCADSPDIRGRCGVVFEEIGDFYHEIAYWYRLDRWSPEEQARFAGSWDKIRRTRSAFTLELLRRLEAADIRLALSTEYVTGASWPETAAKAEPLDLERIAGPAAA